MVQPVNRHYREVKTALKKGIFANPFSLGKYGASPYMACEHGCLYCDGRAEKYYVENDYSKDIIVRKNLPQLLESQLPKLREKAFVSIGSGITDSYQPIEADERLMVQISKSIAQNGFPATIFTKSNLVLRDIDTWKKINESSRFVLFVSLAVTDDSIRRIFEPKAASVDKRLDLLRQFKAAGIPAGVLAMPFLPFITDTMAHIEGLYDTLAGIGVDFIIPAGLTLRPGRQKDIFMETVNAHFPELVEKIGLVYREERKSGAPHWSYQKHLNQTIGQVVERYKIPTAVPHHIYRDQMPVYDEIFVLLSSMKEIYYHRGVNIRPLESAMNRYCDWLGAEKKIFNRRKTLEADYVDNKLLEACHSGRLLNIIQNAKLSDFLHNIIIDRKVFDFTTRRLTCF